VVRELGHGHGRAHPLARGQDAPSRPVNLLSWYICTTISKYQLKKIRPSPGTRARPSEPPGMLLFLPEVDGFVPQLANIKLRKVGQPLASGQDAPCRPLHVFFSRKLTYLYHNQRMST
jgi:hypothetical protein